jgi:hypothetical protein
MTPADLTLIIIAIVGFFTASGAVTATWYHVKRISIEKERSTTMQRYYESLLAIEREKVEIERKKLEARRNGP